jgi:hypothetical protein
MRRPGRVGPAAADRRWQRRRFWLTLLSNTRVNPKFSTSTTSSGANEAAFRQSFCQALLVRLAARGTCYFANCPKRLVPPLHRAPPPWEAHARAGGGGSSPRPPDAGCIKRRVGNCDSSGWLDAGLTHSPRCPPRMRAAEATTSLGLRWRVRPGAAPALPPTMRQFEAAPRPHARRRAQ